MQERKGVTAVHGTPLTLLGPEIKVGDPSPDFQVIGGDWKTVTLGDTGRKVRIIASVPSLDTPVCDMETRRFNEEASKLNGVDILTISVDLPMAQSRWCAGAGVKNLRVLSDYRERSFGPAFGVLIEESKLNARAVFVLDKDNVVRYVEYVKDLSMQPNYEAALEAARKLAG